MEDKHSIKLSVTEDGIILFEFFELHREAAEDFAKLVRAGMTNVPERLRVLYDFSQAPAPSRYFINIQAQLYDEFPHPQDEKSAFVVNNVTQEVWIHIMRSYVHVKGKMQVFEERDVALRWLLA